MARKKTKNNGGRNKPHSGGFLCKEKSASGASRSLRPGWTPRGEPGWGCLGQNDPALGSGVGDKGGVSGDRGEHPQPPCRVPGEPQGDRLKFRSASSTWRTPAAASRPRPRGGAGRRRAAAVRGRRRAPPVRQGPLWRSRAGPCRRGRGSPVPLGHGLAGLAG